MPWIKLNDESKRCIVDASDPLVEFIASENAAGEIFVDGEVYEALKAISPDLDYAIQQLCKKVQ